MSQAFAVVHMAAGANFVHELSFIFEKGHQTDLARIFVYLFFWVSANVFLFYLVLHVKHRTMLLSYGTMAVLLTRLL